MIPTVILSGFKRSGIYPFSPNAPNYRKSKSTSDKITKAKSAQVGMPADGQGSSTSANTPPAFTPEEDKKSQTIQK